MFLFDFRIPEIRQAWRAGIVCAAALFLSLSVLKMDSPQWVVLSALVCLQTNFGASLKRAKERLIGTLLACAVGLGVATYFPENRTFLVILLILGAVIAIYKATLSYTTSIFSLTLAVVVMSILLFQDGKQIVILRIEDVTLGIALGALGSLLLWPDFARKKFLTDLSLLTESKEKLLDCLIGWIEDTKAAQDFFDQKIISSQQNQITRMRMVEMSYEFGSQALPKTIYENFVLAQERIHYIIVTIFNIVNDYNLKKNQEVVFFFHNKLKEIKGLYIESETLLRVFQKNQSDFDLRDLLAEKLKKYQFDIIQYRESKPLSLHESILVSHLEWFAKEIESKCLEVSQPHIV